MVEHVSYFKQSLNKAIILDDDQFDMTEYKVMKQSQLQLVKCQKVIFNNQIKLTYLTNHLFSLKTILKDIDDKEIIKIIHSLINTYLLVKGNGFLDCYHLELSSDQLFYDKKHKTPLFIYVPLFMRHKGDINDNEIDSFFKKELLNLIESLASTQNIQLLRNQLTNTQMTLHAIMKSLDGMKYVQTGLPHSLRSLSKQIQFQLKGCHIRIGKKSDNDIICNFNSAISRQHCLMIIKKNECFIEDLKSANGTYVNGERCLPNHRVKVKVGDQVRIANEEFILE